MTNTATTPPATIAHPFPGERAVTPEVIREHNLNQLEYQRILTSLEQDRVDALMVSEEPEHFTYHATIIELAAKGRIPAIYSYREFVEVGGLMAYSIDQAEIYRHLANLIDKILRGANPGDIQQDLERIPAAERTLVVATHFDARPSTFLPIKHENAA